jgi:hypothetical protein
MPALGNRPSERVLPKAAPPRKPPPAPKKAVAAPAVKLTGLPKTFEGAPKLGKAFQQRVKEHPTEKAAPHHALFSVHTLEKGAEDVGNLASTAYHDTYGTHDKGAKTTKGPGLPPGMALIDPKAPREADVNAGKDALQIGELPFIGGVQAAKAIAAGVTGNLKPAKELGKGVVQGLEHGAVGELLQGHVEGAYRQAQKHPVFTLAEAGGLSGVAGRTTGAALRAAGTQAEKDGIGGALARAGSTVRPPLALTDEAALAKQGLVRQRTYSKDTIRKGAQVLADKRREPILDAKGKPVTIKDRGRTVPVLKASVREQEKYQGARANFEAARTQGVEQLERAKARKTANQIEGPHIVPRRAQRLGDELSQLVASGTIRSATTFKQDLEKRIKTIEDAIQHPEHYRTQGTKASPGELRAAKTNLVLLQKAARNPQVLKNAPQIVQHGLAYAEALNKGDKRLAGLEVHPPEELQRAALSEYALAHMNARHHEVNGEPALRTPKGDVLTNETIMRHAARSGRPGNTLAYVPHIIGAGRKSSFHVPFRPGSRPVFTGQTRTGALYRRGATAIGTELTHEELTKKGVTANNAQAIDKTISEAGLRRPDGQHFNAKEGMETANRLNADGTTQYIPMRAFGAKLDAETQQRIKDSQSPAAMETAHQAMLNDRIVKAGDKSNARNVVLMPKAQIDTLQSHLTPPGKAEKLAQMLNGPFRMAVLPQPRWLAGNFLEPWVVRLPLSGAGVNIPGSAVDFAAASKIVKGMENSGDAKVARAGAEIRGVQLGGLMIGRKGASVRRTYEDFSGNYARAFKAAHDLRNLPPFKQMGDLVLAVPHAFFAFNKLLVETPVQKIAFGKSVREDIQQITGSWTKSMTLGKQALAEVQKGLVDTPTQHRFMEKQMELLGQYDAFNPTMRKLVQTAFPFLPWTLNSLRFVYWTLPAHHTVAFTALVKAAQSVQAEWEAEHQNVPPGTLSDALVQKDKGLVDVGRYTPFGVSIPLAHGETEGLPGTFMPQLSGAQEALSGRDPFGRPLQVPKTASNPKGEATKAERLGIAANSTAESLLPLIAMVRRLQEGGGTAYANSTVLSPKVKPETSHGMGAIDRTLNPFRPTYVKPKARGAPKAKKLGSGLSGGIGSGLGGGIK